MVTTIRTRHRDITKRLSQRKCICLTGQLTNIVFSWGRRTKCCFPRGARPPGPCPCYSYDAASSCVLFACFIPCPHSLLYSMPWPVFCFSNSTESWGQPHSYIHVHGEACTLGLHGTSCKILLKSIIRMFFIQMIVYCTSTFVDSARDSRRAWLNKWLNTCLSKAMRMYPCTNLTSLTQTNAQSQTDGQLVDMYVSQAHIHRRTSHLCTRICKRIHTDIFSTFVYGRNGIHKKGIAMHMCALIYTHTYAQANTHTHTHTHTGIYNIMHTHRAMQRDAYTHRSMRIRANIPGQ